MRFLVTKNDLKAALDSVSYAVANNSPDLNGYYLFRRPLDGSMDKIEVITKNGRLTAKSQFIASVEETSDGDLWMFPVEAWRLNMWLRSKSGDEPLSFSYDGENKYVTVAAEGNSKHKPVNWLSIDFENWPFWDDMLSESKLTIKAPASYLSAAFKHSAMFASSDDTTTPEFCVCECRDGVLASSDRKGASLIYSDFWKDSTIRLHVRDTSSICSFLDRCDQDVEVLEHDRSIFFKCGDNYLVESRPIHQFPEFNHPQKDDQMWWVVSADAIQRGIYHLLSGCDNKNDPRLIFNRPNPDGPVNMMMWSMVGNSTSIVELDVLDEGSLPDAQPLKDEGFMITRSRLEDLLNLYKGSDVRIGINTNPKGDGGYTRFINKMFEDSDQGLDLVTIMSWIRTRG